MPDTELTNDPNGKPHREINPETGQQRAYIVLTEEERAKGFVRPVRRSYIHVGVEPPNNLRDLTKEEKERYSSFGYVAFEKYPEPEVGRYWTQEQLDNTKGCGTITTMNKSIAETYARDPKFYSGTFCCHCKKHFPVDHFVWKETDERVGS